MGDVLDQAYNHLHRFDTVPALGTMALGVQKWDARLWRMGGEYLATLTSRSMSSLELPAGQGPDVYLATQAYKAGGHTPLIGDFVRALDAHQGAASQLIITNIHGENPAPLPEAIRCRLCIPSVNITILQGPSLYDRLQELMTLLLRLRPRRLFLFHHPDDPLASAVARPEIASQRILVHHADSTPSFGLHLPGVCIIDLNPYAAAMTRLLGLSAALLPLTAPDPGTRPRGFLKRGKLVTATSGSALKFDGNHACNYPETVGVILRSTGGWHVHIGPLKSAMLGKINDVLNHANLPTERFVHVPWVPSLAAALWGHDCDLYFSSFPIDGARTNAEVIASATPHLRHSNRPLAELSHSELSLDGGLVWHAWEDLTTTLESLNDRSLLEEKSHLIRKGYDRMHHPLVFAKHLDAILNGGSGFEDPHQHERDHRVLRSVCRKLIASLDPSDPDATASTERDPWRKGKSWRTKLLRWLMRP